MKFFLCAEVLNSNRLVCLMKQVFHLHNGFAGCWQLLSLLVPLWSKCLQFFPLVKEVCCIKDRFTKNTLVQQICYGKDSFTKNTYKFLYANTFLKRIQVRTQFLESHSNSYLECNIFPTHPPTHILRTSVTHLEPFGHHQCQCLLKTGAHK